MTIFRAGIFGCWLFFIQRNSQKFAIRFPLSQIFANFFTYNRITL